MHKAAIPLELQDFLDARGVSLLIEGASDPGLSPADAERFLGMLGAAGMVPLGMDHWWRVADGSDFDGVTAWYSGCNERALDWLRRMATDASDLITVQFGPPDP